MILPQNALWYYLCLVVFIIIFLTFCGWNSKVIGCARQIVCPSMKLTHTYNAFPENQVFMPLEMWDSCKIELISCILWYNSRMHVKLKMVGQEFVITECNNGNLQIRVQQQLQVWVFCSEHVLYFVGRKVLQCICSESKNLALIKALVLQSEGC